METTGSLLSTPRMSNLCRIHVKLVSNSSPQNTLATKWHPRQQLGLNICLPYIVFCEESDSGTPGTWFRAGNFKNKTKPIFLENRPLPEKGEDPRGQGDPKIVPKTGLQLIQDSEKKLRIFWTTLSLGNLVQNMVPRPFGGHLCARGLGFSNSAGPCRSQP